MHRCRLPREGLGCLIWVENSEAPKLPPMPLAEVDMRLDWIPLELLIGLLLFIAFLGDLSLFKVGSLLKLDLT